MVKKKYFIVEDDAIILYGLRAKLCAEGMEVETNSGADSEKDVILQIKKFKPDVIILDLVLPKTDGLSLLSVLKSDEDTLNVPVYIFSNLGDKNTREQCEKLGAEKYFVKSDYNIDEFVENVGKIALNAEKIKINP